LTNKTIIGIKTIIKTIALIIPILARLSRITRSITGTANKTYVVAMQYNVSEKTSHMFIIFFNEVRFLNYLLFKEAGRFIVYLRPVISKDRHSVNFWEKLQIFS